MAITVQEATDSDIPRIFEIFSDTFEQNHEFVNVMYPKHDTAEGRVVGARRMLEAKKDPKTRFIKAIDPSGELIGFAKWTIYGGVVPPAKGLSTKEYWDDEATADYAAALHKSFVITRQEAIKERDGNAITLDALTVDPKHHRKGAGRALIQWGLQRADEIGCDILVEASDAGLPAYYATGFQMIKRVTVEPPEAWTHRPRETFNWMIRPKPAGQ